MGYFEQMAYVDQFVFMDDVQYTRHDWRNRNRIKTAMASIWITVPVANHPQTARIKDIRIDYSSNWVRKHLRSIEVNYRKCPYFQPVFDDLKNVLTSKPEMLIDLDVQLISQICRYLDINTPTAYSSEVPSRHSAARTGTVCQEPDKVRRRNHRIVDICHYFGADMLYDGKKAADFIDVDYFQAHRIKVLFQDYKHPVYRQRLGEFAPYQSIIDLIMNTGPDAAKILRSSPVPELIKRHSS
jgi:hypothetical protein